MAKGRMIAKSISLSRKVNRLSLKSALIYTWGFSHSEDWGDIPRNPEVIKAMVFPMRKDIRVSDIEKFIQEAQIRDEDDESLITEYQDCLHFNSFDAHQTLNPEKRAKPRFQKVPINPQENPGDFQEPQKTPLQEKRREDKGNEDKLLRKEQAREFNQKLFEGLKNAVIDIQDAVGERNKYPSLFRRKNPDWNYWITVAKFSQRYNFRPKEKQEYVFPWKGPVKLSKIYYEVREKYEEERSGKEGKMTYEDMKAKALINTKI